MKSNRPKHLGNPIGKRRVALLEYRFDLAAESRVLLVGEAEVAMAGGLADDGSRRIDARPHHASRIDRHFQGKGVAAHVAHGCETTHEHRFGVAD